MLNAVTTNRALAKRSKKTVNVAVAVICYQDQYLLGYRSSTQHQGDRYEFVGGKIDTEETPIVALGREVREETGIDISANVALKLGRLNHDYGDKQVCLHIYKVELNAEQYQQYKYQEYGLEGQTLTWVDKNKLLNNHYSLPAANQTILAWLKLPEYIAITYPLAHFETERSADQDLVNDSTQSWLQYHQQQLSSKGWSYLRLKVAELEDKESIHKEAKIAKKFLAVRNDISAIIPYSIRNAIGLDSLLLDSHLQSKNSSGENELPLNNNSSQITAYHLTQTELMTWFDQYQNQRNNSLTEQYQAYSANSLTHTLTDWVTYDFGSGLLSSNKHSTTALIISCHDAESIAAANQLASLRLTLSLAPVIAIFLSPVLATKTHPERTPLGWEQWTSLASLADVPVIALGGLSSTMTTLATLNGASSVAGIRSFLKS